MSETKLAEVLVRHESEILTDWMRRQTESLGGRKEMSDSEVRTDSRNLLSALRETVAETTNDDIQRSEWGRVRDVLGDLSRRRALKGFSPIETATFVFSLKEALFESLRQDFEEHPHVLTAEIWRASTLLDRLGLFTTEVFQKSREEVISRQQQEMLELSTPVVELWTGILALPLIGTLDSERTQVVMQNLLEAIVAKTASIAIIDITGVPTVDTLVAQHLLKTVAAARLMGADCIISGIRPQIAQTIIHLGVDLGNVTTKATLSDAFQLSLRRLGLTVAKV